MWANWTRCSGRTSAFAPASSSRNGAPGTGTRIASAGRCTPRARLNVNSDAASAAPVEPPETSASASPAATAATARTIEESGLPRTARAGSGALAIDSGASATDTPSGTAPISAAGPNKITRRPPAAARAAPRATSAGPRSAPLTSTATVRGERALVLVIVLGVVHVHDLAPGVEPAVRADPVRPARPAALRARVHRGRGDLVLRAALRRARVRLLLLGNGHRPQKRSGSDTTVRGEPLAQQRSRLGRGQGPRVVEALLERAAAGGQERHLLGRLHALRHDVAAHGVGELQDGRVDGAGLRVRGDAVQERAVDLDDLHG